MDEITPHPFPNFNGCTIEVWGRRNTFIPHFIMDTVTCPYYDCWSSSIFVKGEPSNIKNAAYSFVLKWYPWNSSWLLRNRSVNVIYTPWWSRSFTSYSNILRIAPSCRWHNSLYETVEACDTIFFQIIYLNCVCLRDTTCCVFSAWFVWLCYLTFFDDMFFNRCPQFSNFLQFCWLQRFFYGV